MAPSSRVAFLVVGLGNPGPRYERTRHNVGFDVVREVARRWGVDRFERRYAGEFATGRAGTGGSRVALLLPHTYMNESGRSVSAARGALHVAPEQVVVVHDEIDLPFGVVRVKQGGGTAGHRGLKSVREGLASSDFWRVRVGVGRPDSTDPEIVSRWVLGRFDEPEAAVRELIAAAADAVERLVADGGLGADGA